MNTTAGEVAQEVGTEVTETVNDTLEAIFTHGLATALVTFLLIFVISVVLLHLFKKAFDGMVKSKRVQPIQERFLRRVTKAVVICVAIVAGSTQFKALQGLAGAMLTSSGVVVVIIGFAAQEAMGNLIGGVFIALFHPFAMGDFIRIEDRNLEGFVEDITLRHTVIRTFENSRIIVPNSVMNSAVLRNSHYHETKTCNQLNIGISYDSDISLAKRIIIEEAIAHKDFLDNRTEEDIRAGAQPVVVRVADLGSSSIDLRAFIWSRDQFVGIAMLSDLRQSIKERFDREGVSIPYPHQVIQLEKS